MREEETDLSFLDFGGTKRHPGGTERSADSIIRKPVRTTPREIRKDMVTRARFERATPSFGGCSGNPVTYQCCFAIRKTWFGPVVP